MSKERQIAEVAQAVDLMARGLIKDGYTPGAIIAALRQVADKMEGAA